MNKKKWLFLICSVYLVIGLLLILRLSRTAQLPQPDLAAMNRIVKATEQNFGTGQFSKPADSPYDYTVAAPGGAVLYQSDSSLPQTVSGSAKEHQTLLPVEKDHQVLGYVWIDTGFSSQMAKCRSNLIRTAAFLIISAIGLVLFVFWYLNRSILQPFMELQGFARHVAAGNLDIPLPMDRSHSFGAFTESFDIMRDQIREARLKEAEANKSKKELTASLSHDMKTPVTAIKLVSELLLATEPQGRTREKIKTISQKAEQIDLLISNMLSASLEDLGKLTIHLADESSILLADFIKDADCFGSVTCSQVPGCIIHTDRQRLCQVLDNILYNSFKYAGTGICISFSLSASALTILIRDYGKGIPDEELPFLFQKYYRGSNSHSSHADGSGLGLYISHFLMEQMGGGIQCYNLEDGFCTELIVPLALPDR